MTNPTSAPRFVKSVEISPRKGTGLDDITRAADLLDGLVDMATAPENPMGKPGIDPVSALIHLTRGTGIEPVPHISPRDKNSLYISSQVMTAMKFGIRKFFVIGGDRISKEIQSREVRELDVFQTINLIKSVGNDYGVNLEVGSAMNPYRAGESEFVARKMEAGSGFFITQILTSADLFRNGSSIPPNARVFAGFMPMRKRSYVQFLERMGVSVRGTRFERISESEDPLMESTRAILETVDDLKGIVSGIHLMTMGDYETARKIMECV